MSRLIYPLFWLIVGAMPHFCIAQPERVLIHSHNDYAQETPFYSAYKERAFSIEADVFAMADGSLLVGHDRSELSDDRTLERLYIDPIVNLFEANGGRAWPNSTDRFVLLIDLKTPAANTLHHIVNLVDAYPAVFDSRVNPFAIQLVISGDMPLPSAFDDYPPFIWFDGRVAVDYTPEQLDRVAFFSANFGDYSAWKGTDDMPLTDKGQLVRVVDSVHAKGKQMRFWATPDGVNSWGTLKELGVDIINTDQPAACRTYFNTVEREKKEDTKQQLHSK